MQKTDKEKDQKSDQTAAAVCKTGFEICESVSVGGEGTSDAYNECETLQGAIERYYERTGHYPERVLGDKIYRNRENLAYCKERGIRLSGPALGRPKKDRKADKKIEATDNRDRIEVERAFSLAKRNYGLGLLKTKLDTTTRSSIALSIIAMNVERLSRH